MYLFSRTRHAKPDKMLEAIPSAVEIAAKVKQVADLDIYVWTYRFGEPLGTIMWSTRVDSQAQLFEATEKMAADPTFVEMVLAMGDFYEGAAVDALFNVVSGNPAPTPSAFLQTNTATIANGKYAEAFEFGVKLQELVATELNRPTFFVGAAYGNFGEVGWITGSETMAEVDAGAEWQQTNPEFHAMIETAADLFLPGEGRQNLLERLN